VKRRNAVKLLSAGLVASRASILEGQLFQIASSPSSYGLQFFSPAQSELLAVLTEIIIPADDHSGGAREANVNLFIDLMIAHSAPAVQDQWTKGLAAFDTEARRRFQLPFVGLDAARQHEIMTFAARNESATEGVTDLDLYFRTLKLMTLNGYYTSATGIHRELQYKGNTALPDYYGCTHPEHKA
jgi:hypothetical protein